MSLRAPVVLVVDDDPPNQKLLAEICSGDGFEVLTASDGDSALEMFGQTTVDLVLVDAALPGMDGFTLCRHLRRQRPVPVIMVTATSDEDAPERARDAGVLGFVTKPFRVFELSRLIRAALGPDGSPSEPPSIGRRGYAAVLRGVGSALDLRAGLRAIRNSGDDMACFAIRLENERELVDREGRGARDALMGFLADAVTGVVGPDGLYSSNSNELVGVLPARAIELLTKRLHESREQLGVLHLGQTVLRHGVVRFDAAQNFDVDRLLRAVRGAVQEAERRGYDGWEQTASWSPERPSTG